MGLPVIVFENQDDADGLLAILWAMNDKRVPVDPLHATVYDWVLAGETVRGIYVSDLHDDGGPVMIVIGVANDVDIPWDGETTVTAHLKDIKEIVYL